MTDLIHAAAARGFTDGVDAYERSRPAYPPDAVAQIADLLGLAPGRTLLELGAGTGKLTRLLAPSGARVLAIEPEVARVSGKVAPQDARWYARVLRGGDVRPGMPVRLIRALPLAD